MIVKVDFCKAMNHRLKYWGDCLKIWEFQVKREAIYKILIQSSDCAHFINITSKTEEILPCVGHLIKKNQQTYT